MQEGEVSIGLICSEKQAIDATLASLASEDSRFTPIADQYWNARGGSHNDGGAFRFDISPSNGSYELKVTNKFGELVNSPAGRVHCDLSVKFSRPSDSNGDIGHIQNAVADNDAPALFKYLCKSVEAMNYDRLRFFVDEIAEHTSERSPKLGIDALTMTIDRRYDTGDKKRSSVLTILRSALQKIFERQSLLDQSGQNAIRRITWDSRETLRAPEDGENMLLIDARGFSPEGQDCDASLAVKAYHLGWRHLVHYNSRGTRFHAAGFGPATDGLRIDCYDNPGDYLCSGMDGLEAYVHCNAQDQLCQISKRGKLVVYGDVGQTFLYGAKGGEIYVLGNAAGRPMINAVGSPRVVINGTALDFLAESFMAGDPLDGGGFAIVNGMTFDENGTIVPLETPYPGSNLLSLASGGAIYVRDPHHTLVYEQLNGGMYARLSGNDWKLILPYLQENERLFGIEIERDLLTVDGRVRTPAEVYRKVMPRTDAEAEAEMEGLGE